MTIQLDKAKFREYLNEFDEHDEVGTTCEVTDCTLARYLTSIFGDIFTVSTIAITRVTKENRCEELSPPIWVRKFIAEHDRDAVDRGIGMAWELPIEAGEALIFLDNVEAEMKHVEESP